MKILIVTATAFEIAPLIQYLEKEHTKVSPFEYKIGEHYIFPLVTGIGAMMTAFTIARYQRIQEIDLAINVGICGALDSKLLLCEVVNVTRDQFADLGVEEKDGSFTDVFDMELENKNGFPYKNAQLINNLSSYNPNLKSVSAITVNKVHGTTESINRISKKYNAQVESMEGAAFFYSCKMLDVEHIQIRSVSNYVEPRNKDNWKIAGSLTSLNDFLIDFLENYIIKDKT